MTNEDGKKLTMDDVRVIPSGVDGIRGKGTISNRNNGYFVVFKTTGGFNRFIKKVLKKRP